MYQVCLVVYFFHVLAISIIRDRGVTCPQTLAVKALPMATAIHNPSVRGVFSCACVKSHEQGSEGGSFCVLNWHDVRYMWNEYGVVGPPLTQLLSIANALMAAMCYLDKSQELPAREMWGIEALKYVGVRKRVRGV
jgi:hypothetical protein